MTTKHYLSIWLVFLIFSTGVLSAQPASKREFHGAEAGKRIHGAVYFVEGNKDHYPSFVKLESSLKVTPNSVIDWLKSTLGTDPRVNFIISKRESDQIGYEHIRVRQLYGGVPVEYSEYIFHFKNGFLESFNGNMLNVNTGESNIPTVSESEALKFALNKVGAEKYMWEDEYWENNIKEIKGAEATHFPVGQLVWFTINESTLRLVYKFDISSASPNNSQRLIIDANTGEVLKVIPLEHNCSGASVNTIFNGMRSFNSNNLIGSIYELFDNCQLATIRVRDWNSSTTTANPVDILNNTNTWTTDNERFGASVLWQIRQTYFYFLNEHGRLSTDNANGMIDAYINAMFGCNSCQSGVTPNNASMNNNGITMKVGLGNGGTLGNSLATVDIIAHEFTHAVTKFSAGLVYQDESGALNESFSDIFGEVIEKSVLGTNDWLLGSERSDGAIRDMANPNAFNNPDTYLGDFWCDYLDGSLNCTMNDNGGVHSNSGVQNYWFYLLSEGGSGTNDLSNDFNVSGIGMSKAAAIAYRNLVVYLGENSTFSDARTGSINAAIDLYGQCSNEVKQVTNAWHAVGVGGRYFDADAFVSSNFKGRDVSCFDECDGSASISLVSAVAPQYLWNTGATTQAINNLCPGTYTVTVTNIAGFGCSASTTVTINNTPQLVAPAISKSEYNGYNISCFGGNDGSATMSAFGGTQPYSVLWNTGATTGTINNLTAGVYSATVTDINGCAIGGTTTMTQPAALNAAASAISDYNGFNVRCFGNNDGRAQVTASGGVSPYVPLWSDGQSTNIADQLFAQTYTVTITDQNGCTDIASTTLTEPSQLVVDAGDNKVVYYGYPDSSCTTLQSAAPSGGVAPYTISWSTGSSDASINVCPSITTVYYFTVIDANDCSVTDSVLVCAIDVRCGINLDKVQMCHVTGNPSNPYRTVCVGRFAAKNHFTNHVGDQLAACGTSKVCEWPDDSRFISNNGTVVYEEDLHLNVHPNPFSSETNVQFMTHHEEHVTLQVVDVTGRVLMTIFDATAERDRQYDIKLDGNKLISGVYFLVMKNESESMQTTKLVIQK